MSDSVLSLPPDPALRPLSHALNEAGHIAIVLDPSGAVQFMSREWTRAPRVRDALFELRRGDHMFGSKCQEVLVPELHPNHRVLVTQMRDAFLHLAPYFLKYYPGGADALRLVVDESFHDLLVGIEPDEPGIVVRSGPSHGWRVSDLAYELFVTTFKVVDEGGRYAGMVTILKPSAGMSSLMSIAATLDTSYLQRLETLAFPSRRRSAVLMADMVGSARLSRRLSTEAFYELSAALLRVGDECIMSAGGIVGRHAGDGMVGFFPAENDAATSDAARRCIEASRSLRLATSGAVADVLRRKRKDSAVIFRHGLHWADRAYIGRIFTRGRIEVTALGQEVAEAARIESCAREGATLASKDLLEQLTHEDAALVGLDLRGLRYRELGSLKTARQKAIRDASEILVCTLDKPRRRKSR